MLEFRAHASSSAGNLYSVTDGEVTLAVECGLSMRRMKVAFGFQVSSLAGVLVSHEHGDHSRAVRDVLKAGVEVYCSAGTAEKLGIEAHHRWRRLQARQAVAIGSMRVYPFELHHDSQEPLGFVISSRHGGRLLYVTDTPFIDYRFTGLTVMAIEANHSVDILQERLDAGSLDSAQFHRTIRNHMSIERCLELLAANDLSQVDEIHLLHLSDGNSDEADFKTRVQRATGKLVRVAGR